jgi:uncharacterized protein VirK/YbjX
MKLYRGEQGWAERLVAAATPSITLGSAVPPHLHGLARIRELAKVRLRALLHPRQTVAWLRLLNSHPAFSEYVRNCPRFLYKVFRPYNSLALCPDERLQAIQDHYAFIFRRGLGQTVARASLAPVVLAETAGKSGAAYRVQLRTVDIFDREGELGLQLAQDGNVIYSIAFTVAPRCGILAVNVGCIQGGKTDDALEAIRIATSDLHGLRPKRLMASLVRQLGHAYGCERMVMVSNRNRVTYKALRHGRVRADYDRLWEEMGASLRQDGDYELPCRPLTAPDMETVPQKKRSQARKRHEMMVQLAEGVATGLRAQVVDGHGAPVLR